TGEAVEIELARIGQSEGVAILLAGMRDGPADLAAERERRCCIGHLLRIEAVSDGARGRDAPLDHHRVRAGNRQQFCRIAFERRIERALPAIGIDQTPVRRVAAWVY